MPRTDYTALDQDAQVDGRSPRCLCSCAAVVVYSIPMVILLRLMGSSSSTPPSPFMTALNTTTEAGHHGARPCAAWTVRNESRHLAPCARPARPVEALLQKVYDMHRAAGGTCACELATVNVAVPQRLVAAGVETSPIWKLDCGNCPVHTAQSLDELDRVRGARTFVDDEGQRVFLALRARGRWPPHPPYLPLPFPPPPVPSPPPRSTGADVQTTVGGSVGTNYTLLD